jgi:hypothetical protein
VVGLVGADPLGQAHAGVVVAAVAPGFFGLVAEVVQPAGLDALGAAALHCGGAAGTARGHGKYGTSNNCNSACTGNANQICGGQWANSIYSVQFLAGNIEFKFINHFNLTKLKLKYSKSFVFVTRPLRYRCKTVVQADLKIRARFSDQKCNLR